MRPAKCAFDPIRPSVVFRSTRLVSEISYILDFIHSRNVWEWCLTAWQDEYTSPEAENNNPNGEAQRVLRGGSWYDRGNDCRAAARFRGSTNDRNFYWGFRVCLSVPI